MASQKNIIKKVIENDVRRFLKANSTAVLATSFKNIPYAATVYYIVDDSLNFYFSTKKDTDKFMNLKATTVAALVIGSGPKKITVQARGHIVVLEKTERQKALTRIADMIQEKKMRPVPIRALRKFKADGPETDIAVKFIPTYLTYFNLDDEEYRDSLSEEQHTIIPGL